MTGLLPMVGEASADSGHSASGFADRLAGGGARPSVIRRTGLGFDSSSGSRPLPRARFLASCYLTYVLRQFGHNRKNYSRAPRRDAWFAGSPARKASPSATRIQRSMGARSPSWLKPSAACSTPSSERRSGARKNAIQYVFRAQALAPSPRPGNKPSRSEAVPTVKEDEPTRVAQGGGFTPIATPEGLAGIFLHPRALNRARSLGSSSRRCQARKCLKRRRDLDSAQNRA